LQFRWLALGALSAQAYTSWGALSRHGSKLTRQCGAKWRRSWWLCGSLLRVLAKGIGNE
jgi:hypothetical protein